MGQTLGNVINIFGLGLNFFWSLKVKPYLLLEKIKINLAS